MARKKEMHGSSSHVFAARAAEWKAMLRQMITIRRFEEASEREFRRGKIGGYLHVYTGQEAVATGILASYRKGDVVYAGYRDHAQTLLLGCDPSAVMAELFGKGTGISHGKGGSMHLFDAAHGFYGGYGIVGGHLTLAAGSAYALRYKETDSIAVCFFGDGSMNIGSFHEALNLAGLWGRSGMCPALFVIENNGYAMGTAVDRHSALTDLGARFDAYAIPNEKVDGQDVFAVHALAERAVKSIRETGKPFCIEAVTYRFSGHGAADILQPYRAKDEVEQQKKRDPIRLMITRLTEEGLVTTAEVEAMEAEAQQIAIRAVEFADQSAQPDPKELFTDIVSDDWSNADTRDDIGEADEEGADV